MRKVDYALPVAMHRRRAVYKTGALIASLAARSGSGVCARGAIYPRPRRPSNLEEALRGG